MFNIRSRRVHCLQPIAFNHGDLCTQCTAFGVDALRLSFQHTKRHTSTPPIQNFSTSYNSAVITSLSDHFFMLRLYSRFRRRRCICVCLPLLPSSPLRLSWASCRRCPSLLCAYVTLFVAKFADLYDSVSLLLEGVAVPVSATRVFKSKEPRGRRVVEALVVGTLGCVKRLHSSTPTCSPGRLAMGEHLVLYCHCLLLDTVWDHYEKEHPAHF